MCTDLVCQCGIKKGDSTVPTKGYKADARLLNADLSWDMQKTHDLKFPNCKYKMIHDSCYARFQFDMKRTIRE
eukprot:s4992_g2.t1